MKKSFDILFSLVGLLLISPLIVIITILILCTSGAPVFYKQYRVGKNNCDFLLWKFRTMRQNSDKETLLTVGMNDARITTIGRFLRKYKLDEVPQLINILKGDMSFVGPRPEVRKYVNLYSDKQRKVLTVRPGLTDYASLHYINENEILANSKDFEKEYIDNIMPHKLELNLKYIEEKSFRIDSQIIFKTLFSIFKNGKS